MRHTIKPAGAISGFLLRSWGFAAITLPSKTIYILPEHDTPALRAHERAHIAQMYRDGWLCFWFAICRDFMVRGYQNSPYEIEARAIEARYV